MMPQAETTEFVVRTPKVAVHPNGTEIIHELGILHYKKGVERLSLKTDGEDIADLIPVNHVFLPREYRLDSGAILTAAQVDQLKYDVRDGLAALGSLVLQDS